MKTEKREARFNVALSHPSAFYEGKVVSPDLVRNNPRHEHTNSILHLLISRKAARFKRLPPVSLGESVWLRRFSNRTTQHAVVLSLPLLVRFGNPIPSAVYGKYNVWSVCRINISIF